MAVLFIHPVAISGIQVSAVSAFTATIVYFAMNISFRGCYEEKMRFFFQPRTSPEASTLLLYSFDSSERLGDSTLLGEDTSAVEEKTRTLHVYLTLRRVISGCFRFFLTLLPSYITHRVTGHYPEQRKLHATAALDGLRGFACLCVFNFHLLFTYTWATQIGWGYDDDNRWIAQLPIIRVLYAGHLMVSIFFVLSGYVLSHKPLKLIRSKSFDKLLQTIASAIFRRVIRLYGPVIGATFCTMLLVQAGLFKRATMIRNDGVTVAGSNEEHPPYFPSFIEQLQDWTSSMVAQLNPFTWYVVNGDYDPHLWTIALEFRGSMVLFLSLTGLGRLHSRYRLWLLAVILGYCLFSERWEIFLFGSGMFIAEVDLIHGLFQDKQPLAKKPAPAEPKSFRIAMVHVFWNAVFAVGLYLGSCPSILAEDTPGYRWLLTRVPPNYSNEDRFWQTIGAILIVWSVNRSKGLQPAFTNAFAQYMGRISFAFYVVHGPVLHSLGYVLIPTIWVYTGKESLIGWTAGCVLGLLVILPVCFWAADLFWRAVDTPCVNFARWIERRLMIELVE